MTDLATVREEVPKALDESQRLAIFLQSCARILGDEHVSRPEQCDWYERNASGLEGQVAGAVRPDREQDVVAVVELANRWSVALYPVSCGRNWGFGSRVPTSSGSVVVDLSRMNRIREVDEQFGYAVVEPGVTQGQLSRHLQERGSPYFLDVTGAGSQTSIIGNAVERGIAYNTLRCETLSALEVVLGSGEQVQTGFGHYEGARTTHVYKHGVGPGLDGLFMQSNFGIVTAATIRLVPRPEHHRFVQIAFSEDRLEDVLARLRELLRRGLLDCIVHIGDRHRAFESLRPALARAARRRGKEPADVLDPHGHSDWTAIGVVRGTRAQVRESCRALRRELRTLGRVQTGTEGQLRWAAKLAGAFGRRSTQIRLEATLPLLGPALGVPCDIPVEGVSYGRDTDSRVAREPDLGTSGLLFCVPIAPLDGVAARGMVDTARSIASEFGFTPAITLNVLDRGAVEAVISIGFDRSRPEESRLARECIHRMNRAFVGQGLVPYRVGADDMAAVVDPQDPYWQLVRELGRVMDPNGIIAPGRYSLA
jgi:4-cresol dehydrogenase (hydroxylating)